jgi:hypothetical protein
MLPRNGLRVAGGAVLALVLTAGIAIRISEAVRARLWIDEYLVLEIGSQPTAAAVAEKLRHEANPPLYYVMAHAVLGAADDPELVLRLVSVLAGTLTAVLASWTAWRRWGPLAALTAAALVSASAIAIHYSVEIRPFALLGLVILMYLEVLDREIATPSALTLLIECLLILLATSLHAYGAPLLFVGPAVCLAARRPALLIRQVLAAAAAGAVLLPSVLLPLWRLAPETNEYLADIWQGHGFLAPVGLMLRELLPTARWPSTLQLASVALRAAEGTAAVLAAAIAVAALATVAFRRAAWRPDTYTVALITLLAGNAAMAALFTMTGRPITAPGRFSAPLVAPFALVVAALGRAAPIGRVCSASLAAMGLLVASLRTAQPPARGIRPEALSAEVLGRNMTGPSLVLTVGLTGVPLRYAFRGRPEVTFRTYPLEIESHIGWWAPRRSLGRPDDLARDADVLARVASAAARSGERVFVEGADKPVAAPLLRTLAGSFRPRPLNRLTAGLIELVPTEETLAKGAR